MLSVLIRERKGFTLQPEYGTEPRFIMWMAESGGKDLTRRLLHCTDREHMQHLSTVDADAKKRL
jgi:hypothetical protein